MSSTNYLVVALLGRRLLLLLLITCLQLRCGGSFHNIIPIIIRREQSPVTTKLKFVRNIGGDTTTADYSPSSNSANSCRRSRDETIATATKWKWQTATTTSTTSGRKPAVIRLCASQLYDVTNATESTRTSTTTTTTTENRSVIIPPGVLGPPEELRRLNLGQSLTAVRKAMVAVDDDCMESNGPQQSVSEKELRYTIERVSFTPDVFVLRNYLSPIECNTIINQANKVNMAVAETTTGDAAARKKSKVAWLPSDDNQLSMSSTSKLISGLISSTAKTFLSKDILSHPDAGVEDLQVLKYDVGGEFVLHHDGAPRVLTVIYYVNGVGGTWFPLARTDEDLSNDPCRGIDVDAMDHNFSQLRKLATSTTTTTLQKNAGGALNLGNDHVPGVHGILVKGLDDTSSSSSSSSSSSARPDLERGTGSIEHDPTNPHVAWIHRGDAVAFYNYRDDGSGRLDWRALHTGLPTTEEDGVKWIANHWFRLNSLAKEC